MNHQWQRPISPSHPEGPWQNYDSRDHYWYQAPPHNPYRRISIVDAMNIALEQVPGEVVKTELETDKGIRIYEVDIVTVQGMKYEVKVDVSNGRILSVHPD